MTSGGQDRETAAAGGDADGGVPDPAGDESAVGPVDGEDGDTAASTDGDPSVFRDWTRADLKRSALGGLAAYLASYALLYLWFLSEGRMSSEFTDWRWVGWILYHGQFVPLDVSPGGTSADAAETVATGLGALANVLPALLLSVAVALVAGFLLARARDPAEPDRALEAGASLVVGYLPPAVLGVVVFAGRLPNGVHVRPDPLLAPIVTGVVFPAVVGAFGGLAFVAWRQRGATDGSATERRAGGETTRESSDPVEDDAPDAESPDPRS